MSLKIKGEFCVMTMKNDAKVKEEFTCQFEIDMRNRQILTQTLKNLKHFHFSRLLLIKVFNV